MTIRKEPSISIFTSDTTNSSILQNTINTALLIKSSMGVTTPQLISNRAELLDKYSSKGFISENDDITFKSAYYLLGFTPLWVCRVSSDKVTVGLTNSGNIVFKNVNDTVIKNNINNKLIISDSSNNKFNLYVKTAQNNVYYCGKIPTIDGTKIKLSTNKLSSEEFMNLLISNSKETIIYNKINTGYQLISDSSEKIVDVSKNYLIKNEYKADYITINLESNKLLTNNDFIVLNNTLYYFDNNESLPVDSNHYVVNKLSLRFPTNSLLTDIYITYLEQELVKQSNYTSLIKFTLNLDPEIKVSLSNELSQYITVDKTNSIQSKNAILESGYIILSRGGINNLFYIGEVEPDVSSLNIKIDNYYQFNKNSTINRLLMGIYENAVFKAKLTDKFDYTNIKITVKSLKIIIPANLLIYESNWPEEVGTISNIYYSVVELSNDEYNIINKKVDKFYISIDSNVYYIGDKPVINDIESPVYIQISKDAILFKDILDKFIKYFNIDYQVYLDNSNNINILSNKELAIAYDKDVDIEVKNIQNIFKLNDKFAVFSKFTSEQKIFSYTVEPTTDPEIYLLKVYIKSDQYEYTISFNPDKVDGFGTNLYYTKVNSINPYIEIIEIDSKAKITNFKSKTFGNEVNSMKVTSEDYITSLDKFSDLEGIKFDLIVPGGYANMQYIKALVNFGSNIDNYTKVVMTTPEYKTIDLIIKYRVDLGINNWQAQLFCQWFKTTINDFMITLPVELLYVERVVTNFLSGNQFNPIFGKNTGLVNYNPTVSFNKKQREELLGNRIIPIRYDKQNNISYFVDNLNLINLESYLGNNENFVRVVNTMAHVADFILEDYIAKANNGKIRKELTLRLDSAFSEIGLNSNDFIKGIKIICDETNNPQSIIDQNKLIVDVLVAFNNNIKYIQVFQKVVTTIA